MKKQELVSFYASLFRTECQVLTLEEIIILIRRRRWQREIIAYRTALAEGRSEEARRLKGGLPGFTPSGVFKGGHKASAIETYSQVVGLDFDHVEDLAALILIFRMLDFTLAMFVSPSGEGLKVFVRVDCPPRRHREAYLQVAAFFEKAGGVASDAKCKDISRCCYVSDDPEAYYNPDATVFHIPEEQSAEEGVDAFVTRFLDRNPPLAGSRNQTVYRLGCEANRRGFRMPKQSLAARSACKQMTSLRQKSSRRYILLIKGMHQNTRPSPTEKDTEGQKRHPLQIRTPEGMNRTPKTQAKHSANRPLSCPKSYTSCSRP